MYGIFTYISNKNQHPSSGLFFQVRKCNISRRVYNKTPTVTVDFFGGGFMYGFIVSCASKWGMKPWKTELLDSSCEKMDVWWMLLLSHFQRQVPTGFQVAAVSGHVGLLLYICVHRRKACNDIKLYNYIYVYIYIRTCNIPYGQHTYFTCLTQFQFSNRCRVSSSRFTQHN